MNPIPIPEPTPTGDPRIDTCLPIEYETIELGEMCGDVIFYDVKFTGDLGAFKKDECYAQLRLLYTLGVVDGYDAMGNVTQTNRVKFEGC